MSSGEVVSALTSKVVVSLAPSSEVKVIAWHQGGRRIL